jgi:acyl-coenzyme A synthetase/AMP-(fatty) acid ligase
MHLSLSRLYRDTSNLFLRGGPISVKGFQVSPKELEELLAEDPLVADVAVVGFSDEKQTKQIPWAFAVASPCDTEQTLELVATAILKRANEQLAAYKRIQGLTWLDALPKR